MQSWFAKSIAISALVILSSAEVSVAQSIPFAENFTEKAIAQNITSVSELSDVGSTDWAFTALQSLVDRYRCIAGYPDKNFRGKQ